MTVGKAAARLGKEITEAITTIVKKETPKSTKKETRGRKSKRGRPIGSKVEREEAKKLGLTVKQLREGKKSAKRMKRAEPTVASGTIETQEGGYQAGFPTGESRRAMLSSLGTMPKGAERGEVGRLLRSQRAEDRPPAVLPSQQRVPRTEGVESVGEGINTRLRSLHRPDYKEVHDQAVAFLKEKVPGKSEAWYERKAIQLIEADFRKGEQGQEVISGTPSQVMGMMRGREQAYLPEEVTQVTGGGGGIEAQLRDLVSQFQAGRGRKHGGIVRRRKGGAIGVGAALRGYGKGYKKGGKI